MTDLKSQIEDFGRRARAAARVLARTSAEQKNQGLLAMADEIVAAAPSILEANAKDVAKATAEGLSKAMIDRLTLDTKRLEAMADGIRQVAALPDPVGEQIRDWTRPNGLRISKVRVPIGVVGIIYESRPNVTSDAAVLCTKTGNATILRGGSESIHSNVAIAAALSRGAAKAGLPEDSVLLIPTTDREAVKHLCAMDKYLDVIVPRGGKGLIETVVSHARMPVIKHYDGICIIYVDKEADLAMAENIVLNAKCQRPGVCNAIETVLVHRDIADQFFATTGKALLERNVEIRGDDATRAALGDKAKAATPEDYRTEFLDLIIASKVVGGVGEAIDHIELNGSHHSDGIVTANEQTAERFLAEVDSATVYWNASTRFTDGGEFGFGAEIGISTDKLHARGPMALEELTTYKYLLRGTGQIRN
ncbi:gamma-glutamyl phosphate reductase [Chthoniobacter flavus Ellin428]|uniref:Gamma-glutamyl phosphate reductase n=1 Tax=Chthoniobacter flavus Ellin428 TaxID=497964 RepID=B4CYZ8_9BACT|nr:glutamate-5-semialdehyde dehydrogenase [Chthoniobacter flavus]EDY20689.1 gamma-glutamyl phosphate reductase [Chthoniobacter flavus Ellin428]TCO89587.1 glutamate-5-semialdehyde dehydrogenase [Chthoniobacter flavus]